MPPLKLAIIGGGPSAFYVASRLLSLTGEISIHIYDKLWAPHGLVRYGVAPDHPEVKNCTHKFDEIARNKRFKFFGNVNVAFPHSRPVESQPKFRVKGSSAVEVPIAALYPHYTHLLISTGAPSPVIHPLIPPSEHCIPALDIVYWYTSHPSGRGPPPLSRISHMTILGMGNVSLDVARILLSPVDALRKTEMRDDVLEVLRNSKLKHVSVLGRRGPLEAKFGNKEVREMMTLDDVGFLPLAEGSLELPPKAKPDRKQSRFLSLLKGGSTASATSSSKTWDLSFFQSPTELLPAPFNRPHEYQLDLKVSHTALSPVASAEPSTPGQDTVAIPTATTSTKGTDLLVTSLGQLTVPLSLHDPTSNTALESLSTTFNRLYTSSNRLIKNVYTSGWAAVGARGVLNTTLLDANSVSDMILSDSRAASIEAYIPPLLTAHPVEPPLALLSDPTAVEEGVPPLVSEAVRDGRVTTYEDWKTVDEYELKEGKAQGKERAKLIWSEVLEKGLIRR